MQLMSSTKRKNPTKSRVILVATEVFLGLLEDFILDQPTLPGLGYRARHRSLQPLQL
jgi:hypothetical protein